MQPTTTTTSSIPTPVAATRSRLGLDELTMLRGALEAMRTEALERADHGAESAAGAVAGTGADRAYESLVSDAVERARALVEDIDDALARMNEGSYGRCQSCGEEIAVERLEAIPQTRTCVGCTGRRRGLLG